MIQTVRNLLPVETLPEADACLREKLIRETTTGAETGMMLASTMQYIARFADAALLSDVRKAYEERTDSWDQQARGAALTYLMRWDAGNSRPLLDEVLLGPGSPPDGDIILDLLESAYDPADGLREALREYLQTASPQIAASCAFALAQIGEPEDRALLRKTLEQLRSRDAEFSHSDGEFEVELVIAVARGRSWESTTDEIAALLQTCRSKECKQRFQ
jgi:hypothetical protein